MGAPPRVGVREVPGGFFSSYLVHEVRPGDEIEVLPPSGTFTADLSVPGDHVFVVAGSGITPALSPGRAPCCATASPPSPSSTATGAPTR
jgi:ring-1,2-phenylacetyl-CoA epoxidase subunit PaaE